MYFADDDMVAVHTLACAAREIYEQHCDRQGIDRMFEYIKTANPGYDSKQLWNVLNGARNFFKHPGESLADTIELRDQDNKCMLFCACHDCAVLCGPEQPLEVQVFNVWFLATETPTNSGSSHDTQAAAEIQGGLDRHFAGLRDASPAEQKRRGMKLLGEAEHIMTGGR
ncbi:hypothetical protein [Cupriavidus sp. D39]|uniref:hypothetical protein n=1 Tax=Cupriavidus sp. D39 TaxID=2997877 RepID=UPI00226D71F6|nr:hypothetical protein [Cupriavidus sp. D39]MCY0852520.1 hypothetical protein [Cupriavidus sp. D39]